MLPGIQKDCVGRLTYVGYFTSDDEPPMHVTSVLLATEKQKYFTGIAIHREVLMEAYYNDWYVELLTNNCHGSDRTFSSFRIHRKVRESNDN